MTTQTHNFDDLSDSALRNILLEENRLNSLSRDDLIKEVRASKASAAATNNNGLKVHPLSTVAVASASPRNAHIKAVQGILPWEWAIGAILVSVFLYGAVAFNA